MVSLLAFGFCYGHGRAQVIQRRAVAHGTMVRYRLFKVVAEWKHSLHSHKLLPWLGDFVIGIGCVSNYAPRRSNLRNGPQFQKIDLLKAVAQSARKSPFAWQRRATTRRQQCSAHSKGFLLKSKSSVDVSREKSVAFSAMNFRCAAFVEAVVIWRRAV
jgi:hypothetical protein